MTNQKKTKDNKNYKNQKSNSEKIVSNSSKEDINSKKETKPLSETSINNTNQKNADMKKEEKKVEIKKVESEFQPNKKQDKKQDTKQDIKKEFKQNIIKQPKKQGKGAILLALLLGATGTAIATYTFTQTRDITNSQDLVKAEVTSTLNNLKTEIAKSSKTTNSNKIDTKTTKNIAEIKQQIEQISNKLNSLNSKVVEIEQIQAGVTNKAQETVTELMKAENKKIDTLTAKLNELELGQKGLVNNFSASTNSETVAIDTTKFDEQIQTLVTKINDLETKQAAQKITTATTGVDAKQVEQILSKKMILQEVGYSLRLANNKLQAEGSIKAVNEAVKLLKTANKKISSLKASEFNIINEDISAKLIRLQGVSPIKYNEIIKQIKTIDGLLTSLKVKSTETKTKNTKEVAESSSLMSKAMGVVKDSFEFIPENPNSGAITEKASILQKRFIQADLKTSELAIKLKDKTMLLNSLTAVKSSLKDTFANDKTQTKIVLIINDLETIDLNLTLPDLSSTILKFEHALTKYNNL